MSLKEILRTRSTLAGPAVPVPKQALPQAAVMGTRLSATAQGAAPRKPEQPQSVREQETSQQRPGVDVQRTQQGKRPEATVKSPRDTQKSPAGQLVRNRVEFNPLL